MLDDFFGGLRSLDLVHVDVVLHIDSLGHVLEGLEMGSCQQVVHILKNQVFAQFIVFELFNRSQKLIDATVSFDHLLVLHDLFDHSLDVLLSFEGVLGRDRQLDLSDQVLLGNYGVDRRFVFLEESKDLADGIGVNLVVL